jgi:Putative adhesin
MSAWEFPTDGPVDLQLHILSGSVTVSATATQTATVTIVGSGPGARADTAATVAFDQGTLSVSVPGGSWPGRHGSVDATVELPAGSSCDIDATSADVRCTGQLRAADIRTMSGDIEVEQVDALAELQAGSGDVDLGAAGEAKVQTSSGDVSIGMVGDASIRTASGDVGIAAAAGRQVEVKCSSGDIGVGVAPGLGVYLDLSSVSGTVSSELEPAEGADDADMTLCCRSISGEVRVSSASQVADRVANQI